MQGEFDMGFMRFQVPTWVNAYNLSAPEDRDVFVRHLMNSYPGLDEETARLVLGNDIAWRVDENGKLFIVEY